VIGSNANRLDVEVQERMPTGFAGRETSHNSGPLCEIFGAKIIKEKK